MTVSPTARLLGAIRTIGNSEFVGGVATPIHGDTWFAVMEFAQTGVKAEALLGYVSQAIIPSDFVRSG